MPYIKYAKKPERLREGRQARGVSYRVAGLLEWAAEVDEVEADEIEITEQEYVALVEANEAANAAYTPPAPPAPEPDPDLTAIDAVLAKADSDVTAAEVKALLLRWARRARARGRI